MPAETLAYIKSRASETETGSIKAVSCADVRALLEERDALLSALKAITERAEAVSEGIHVEKRSNGVSQARHVGHMAGHLAQHAKIARAAIAKAEGS